MKYESDILEMLHEKAMTDYKLGFITEDDMREYDELCLSEKTTNDDFEHEDINIKHAELVTA